MTLKMWCGNQHMKVAYKYLVTKELYLLPDVCSKEKTACSAECSECSTKRNGASAGHNAS